MLAAVEPVPSLLFVSVMTEDDIDVIGCFTSTDEESESLFPFADEDSDTDDKDAEFDFDDVVDVVATTNDVATTSIFSAIEPAFTEAELPVTDDKLGAFVAAGGIDIALLI